MNMSTLGREQLFGIFLMKIRQLHRVRKDTDLNTRTRMMLLVLPWYV